MSMYSSAGINLASSEKFVFGFKNTVSGLNVKGGNSNEYASGTLWLNSSVFSHGGYDLAFRTYMESTPVPEPSTLLLLGTGLVGLVGYGRRQKQRA